MVTTENPYASPDIGHEAGSSAVRRPRPPHALLWAQVSFAIISVFVGNSEVNAMFAWAQWLMPIVVVGGPVLMASPFVITAICVRRRVSSIRTIAALALSISLTTVAIWGMLPAVQ
jgi:hypothetical protein